MKPLFAIDVTRDRHNKAPVGEEFITRSLSTPEAPSNRKYKKRSIRNTRKNRPFIVKLLSFVTGVSALAIAAVTAFNSVLYGFINNYYDSKPLFWCGVGCSTVWALLTLFAGGSHVDTELLSKEDLKKKAVFEVVNDVYAGLGVPSDAEDVDVFSFYYKLNKGQNEIVVPRTQYTEYVNLSMRIFVRDRKLCLADLANVYSIELSSLKRIIRVDRSATFPYWNKDETPKDSLYSPFNITYRNGVFKIKPYYLLLIEKDNKDYGIYFPAYELKKFERLCELTAE